MVITIKRFVFFLHSCIEWVVILWVKGFWPIPLTLTFHYFVLFDCNGKCRHRLHIAQFCCKTTTQTHKHWNITWKFNSLTLNQSNAKKKINIKPLMSMRLISVQQQYYIVTCVCFFFKSWQGWIYLQKRVYYICVYGVEIQNRHCFTFIIHEEITSKIKYKKTETGVYWELKGGHVHSNAFMK